MKIKGIIHTEVEIDKKEIGKALLEEVKNISKYNDDVCEKLYTEGSAAVFKNIIKSNYI